MLYIADNLKVLRNRGKLTQQQVADGIKVSIDSYKKYEYGKNTPPAEVLLDLSRFYHISIDLLLTVSLNKFSIENLVKLEDNRIVLPIKVDKSGNNLIEIVPHKARMGYASGYSDPEFIESLQTITLPFLRNGKFRAFPASGDSMPPHRDSSFIVGKYMDNLEEVKDGNTYILVTKNDGIVYKRLKKGGSNTFIAQSDNTLYAPFEIPYKDVLELWAFACSVELEAFEPNDLGTDTIMGMFRHLEKEIKEIKRS